MGRLHACIPHCKDMPNKDNHKPLQQSPQPENAAEKQSLDGDMYAIILLIYIYIYVYIYICIYIYILIYIYIFYMF